MENLLYRWERLSNDLEICVTDIHKFGTDAFLLSTFAKARRIDRCADFGTGCGIVALLWYRQREQGPKETYCVDIQPQAIQQLQMTVEKFSLSPNIHPILGDLRELGNVIARESLDLITCNPPYKAPGSGIISAQESDQIARHEVMCNLEQLCQSASRLLKFGGRLCICQRPERLADAVSAMKKFGIEPKRLRLVSQRADTAPWLFLMEGKKGAKSFLQVEKNLIIEGPGGFSREMLDIYQKKENKKNL